MVATILCRDGDKEQMRFDRDDEGILSLRSWVIENECNVVACESTSDFWVPIYDTLIHYVPVIVGNARDMKAFTHKKTDKVDSEFIAQLSLNNMIKPSRIFAPDHRQFRSLVRLRFKLVQKRTDIKNEASSVLSSQMLHLNDVLTDIYGKNGRMILSGICDGQDIDHIVSKLTHNVRKKADQIRAIFKNEVPQYVLIRLKSCLKIIESIDKQITILENEIFRYANKYHKREMDILLSCPGIGELSAATLIAEICDFHDFSSGDKLASWLGIVPNVYQSADKYYNGRITKRGSRVARWILTQVAQAAARTKNSKLKMFFNRKVKTIGFQKAIIALARKIVTIIWHLITNDEMYDDETGYHKGEIQKKKIVEALEISVDDGISIISEVFAILSKKDPDVT